MNPPTWFRFHLSTAMVLMLAISAMLGMNVTKHQGDFGNGFGWPMTFMTPIDVGDNVPLIFYHWEYKNLVIDIVSCFALLIVAAIVLEKRIAILQRLKEEKRRSEGD